MMEKPSSGFKFLLPGIMFIVLGVVLLIEPRILIWLVALAFIFMGVAMLMLAKFVRRIGT